MSVSPRVLGAAFTERFGGAASHLSYAPGRVNLLGEHTDYNDLPVLPVALSRGISLAFRPRTDGTVRLANLDSRFHPIEFEVGAVLEPVGGGHWGDYPRAAAREVARRLGGSRGFEGVVGSNLPVASGLSSSSALTNAVGLALAHIAEVDVPTLEFANAMAEAERFTGTRGGGMDQAISLCGRAGHATRIDFRPLRVHHWMIPEDWRFVVADTGVVAEKSGAAQATYNLRRRECEGALGALAGALAGNGSLRRTPRGYPELIRHVGGHREAISLAERHLEGSELKRFRHVVSEACRVEEARDALMLADATVFGDLMNASHASLRADFLVSSVELDALVGQALEGGARGARLTGAGFGGCIVALADAGTVDSVVGALRDRPLSTARHLAPEDRAFVVEPSDGGRVGEMPGVG